MARRPHQLSRVVLGIGLLILALTVAAAYAYLSTHAMHSWPTPMVRDDERQVNLLSVGDWGAQTDLASDVADGMRTYTTRHSPRLDAVLLNGDNYYDIDGPEPPFGQLFERLFDPAHFNVPFYAVLGNHDYGEEQDQIQLDYNSRHPQSRWQMPGRWYRLETPRDNPLVTILMLDSNRDRMSPGLWEAQHRWLTQELQRPRQTTWLMVVAHHPLYSSGHHGDDPDLQKWWGRLFQEHGVDFYVSGHDHDLEHLRIPGAATEFIISGGGGSNIRELKRTDRGPFATEAGGFVHFRFGQTWADVNLVGARGQVLYRFSRPAGDPPQPPATQP